jgi:hypothetical protein
MWKSWNLDEMGGRSWPGLSGVADIGEGGTVKEDQATLEDTVAPGPG